MVIFGKTLTFIHMEHTTDKKGDFWSAFWCVLIGTVILGYAKYLGGFSGWYVVIGAWLAAVAGYERERLLKRATAVLSVAGRKVKPKGIAKEDWREFVLSFVIPGFAGLLVIAIMYAWTLPLERWVPSPDNVNHPGYKFVIVITTIFCWVIPIMYGVAVWRRVEIDSSIARKEGLWAYFGHYLRTALMGELLILGLGFYIVVVLVCMVLAAAILLVGMLMLAVCLILPVLFGETIYLGVTGRGQWIFPFGIGLLTVGMTAFFGWLTDKTFIGILPIALVNALVAGTVARYGRPLWSWAFGWMAIEELPRFGLFKRELDPLLAAVTNAAESVLEKKIGPFTDRTFKPIARYCQNFRGFEDFADNA